MVAVESKTTKRPSAEILGRWLGALAWVPSVATLRRVVELSRRSRRKIS